MKIVLIIMLLQNIIFILLVKRIKHLENKEIKNDLRWQRYYGKEV